MKKYRTTSSHDYYKAGLEFTQEETKLVCRSQETLLTCGADDPIEHPTWFEEIDSRWKPEQGEKYYRIAISGTTGIGEPTWHERQEDYKRWEMGNVFRTKKKAEQARDKVRSLLLNLH